MHPDLLRAAVVLDDALADFEAVLLEHEHADELEDAVSLLRLQLLSPANGIDYAALRGRGK